MSILGGYFATKLTLQSDLAALLPDSFESVKALNRIKEEVGAVGDLRVIIESPNFNAAKAFAQDLASKLEESPFVNYLDYKNEVAFYRKNALLFLEMDELDSLHLAIQNKIDSEKQKLNPLFVDDLFGDDDDESAETDLADWEEKYQDKEPREYYTNEDSTVLVMKVVPTGTNTSLSFVQDMIEEVEKIVDTVDPERYDPDMHIFYGGNFKKRLGEYEVIKSDIGGTAFYGFGGVFLLIVVYFGRLKSVPFVAIALLMSLALKLGFLGAAPFAALIFFLIIVYFRQLTGAILITVTLLMSLSWTFGVTYWVIGNLNTITGFLFVILFGLGIDYGIHAFARYTESRRSGLSFEQSLEKLVCQTGKALATTAVTTSAAFFSLMFMEFKGFSDLGFIAGMGMLFALVAMVIVLPAFITLFEKYKLLTIKTMAQKSRDFRRGEFQFSKPILLVSGLLTLFAIYSISQIDFEYDFTNLRAMTKERKISSEKTTGIFKLSESPAVVLADSKQELNEIVDAVRELIKEDTFSPTVKTVRSIYSLIPENQEHKLTKIRKIRQLVDNETDGLIKGEDEQRLDKLRQYLQVDEPFTWEEFPEKDKQQFVTKKGEKGNFVFIYPSVPLRHGKNAIAFRNDVGKIKTASGKTYYASSSNIILAEMLTIMIREGRLAVLLSLFVVFFIVFLDFRNLKATLFVLAPLVLGVLWMGVVMYLLGMKLNLFNIVVLPSVIGIGVDNGVHIYHRYKEEGSGSLYHVLKNTGLAIFMTTLTTIIGYSGLILARHPGLNSIGDLAVIGISITFLTSTIVLPALLQFFEKTRAKIKPKPALESASQS
ncbi:MAG: RND family transporter [bacterium]